MFCQDHSRGKSGAASHLPRHLGAQQVNSYWLRKVPGLGLPVPSPLHMQVMKRRSMWVGHGQAVVEAQVPSTANSKLLHFSTKLSSGESFLAFFLFRFIYFYCKVRHIEKRRDREEDLPSDDSLPK